MTSGATPEDQRRQPAGERSTPRRSLPWRPRLRGTLLPAHALARWIAFGVAIGVVAGLGAIAFFWLIQVASRLFVQGLAGYRLPAPAGEGHQASLVVGREWALPLVVALGGLLSGVIVFLTAPEAEGHGTDAAIDAFHHRAGRIRPRVPPIKLLASAITIGSGGSAGREGPTAQISAGFGSLLGQWLRLEPSERRILVAAGMGAGIGAIFRAPLGGAVLAAEILYLHDLEVEALLPALVASIIGYSIFGAWAGWEPIFGAQPEIAFANPLQLVYYALLGLICGGVGILYAGVFYGVTDLFRRVPLPNWLKPAIGGLLVGLLGLVLPGVVGTGYGWVQMGMDQRVLHLSLWVVLLLPLAKIVATSLSIGSGGSGGIFGPGMVIGGMTGAAFWRVSHAVLPGVPAQPAPFTIVAMMAMFGGIAHAPLAVMLMVAEMTGNLSLLAPAMIAVGIATLVTGDRTIYRSQLPTRADSPAHRYQFSFPLLSSLTVREAMQPLRLTFAPSTTLADAERHLAEISLPGAPVVDPRGRLVGVFTLADIQRVPPPERARTPVETVMTRDPVTTTPEAGLDVALESLATHRVSWMPVVEGLERAARGTVSAGDIVAAYRGALGRSVRRLRGLTPGTVLLESRVEPRSPLAGRAVRDLRLPGEALIVAIQRDGLTIVPRGSTELAPGDVLTVLVSPAAERAVRAYLTGELRVDGAARPSA